jgi:hypothetical protein
MWFGEKCRVRYLFDQTLHLTRPFRLHVIALLVLFEGSIMGDKEDKATLGDLVKPLLARRGALHDY